MLLRTEIIGGQSYSLHQQGDERWYEPPLPKDEVQKRAARDAAFAGELQSGQCARGMTDDVYLGGMPHLADTFGEAYAKEIYAEWDRQGISYTANTNYNPFHAEYKGDPAGIIDGRSSERRRKEMLAQLPLVDPRETAPKLADDLIQECAENFTLDHPDEARKMTKQDMRAHMIDKHAPK